MIQNSINKGKVSVVLSFWNEEAVIPQLIARLRGVLRGLISELKIDDYELIFVNDLSTDNSVKILQAECEHGDIRVVNMSRNFGVSPCVMAGFAYSTGDAVIYMDADLQDPPELIAEMVEHWFSGSDIVHTVRKSRAGESRIKMFLTKIGYRVLQLSSQVAILSNSGDFKLISRRALNEVLKFKEKKPFVRGIITSVGFRQSYVYYDRESRFSGATKFPIYSYKVISNFLDSALISFSDFPLKLVSIVGILMSGASFLLLLHVLVEKVQGNNIPGWTAIMVAITFLGGIQLIGLGVVGLYVNAIFLESKGRPSYIVESTIGFNNNKQTRIESSPLKSNGEKDSKTEVLSMLGNQKGSPIS